MVIRSSVMSAFAVLALACSAYAQQPPPKMGVISVQGAIVGTKDGQKASQELTTKFEPKQKDIQARQAALAQMKDQYQKGGNLMSEDKRSQLARDVDEKQKRLERDVQDAQEELNAEQQRVLQGLGQRMMAVIEKYAKDNGYSMILDVSNPNTPVLYASSGIDITQNIISLYDKTTANGAPATTPGASATPPAGGADLTPKPTPGTTAVTKPPAPGSRQ
jgi:outer membrane protein